MKTNEKIVLEAMASRIRELERSVDYREMALEQAVQFISIIHTYSVKKSDGRAYLDDYVEAVRENMTEKRGNIQTDYLAYLCYAHIDKSLLLNEDNVEHIKDCSSASGYGDD